MLGTCLCLYLLVSYCQDSFLLVRHLHWLHVALYALDIRHTLVVSTFL